MRRRFSILFLSALLIGLANFSTGAAAQVASNTKARQTVTIGVLSHRGDAATLAAWSPTAAYLSSRLPKYRFEFKPLDFDAIDPAVKQETVDFILANSGIYVTLEVRFGVSRIATMYNRRNETPYNIFGGVIFTRADREDLRSLTDLRGKSFAAVDRTSLGGFQMAWRVLNAEGLNPYRDFSEVKFMGIHDRVVMSVLNGQTDVGTVRTDILERMIQDGKIEPTAFRIINPQPVTEAFPFIRSTELYPEWPLAKTRRTSNDLAQEVAITLMQMPRNHPAAKAGRHAGWTVPLDYQPVHELFKELRLGPYQNIGKFTLSDVADKYLGWILAGAAVIAFMVFMTGWVLRLNRALQAAKEGLERRYDLILNSVGDGIYGVNLDGKSTFVNPAMERITGWKPEEVIGQGQHDLLHHTHPDGSPHPREQCPVYKTMRDDQSRNVDDIFWRKDGSSFPVEYTSAPLRDEKGATVGAVVVFRDITERKRAEDEALKHHSEMAHVARLNTMGEMATTIAHELNQPLSAIANYTNACIRMLKGDDKRIEEVYEAMGLVSAQAQRAGEIIRQIRNFIRKAGPSQVAVDVNDLICDVVSLVNPEIRKNGISLNMVLASDLPKVLAHAIEIEQVAMNLVRNAIEAMANNEEDRTSMQIKTSCSGNGNVEVAVSDSGQGLEDKAMGSLFSAFYTTKSSGTGLGLSISKRIIETHGGELWATDNQGPGATFHFTLPVEEANNKERQNA